MNPATEATGDVTRLLLAHRAGDREALDRLLPLVYEQLKRLAHARLRGERPGHTLNTTALVHEAYLELVDITRVQWKDRAHFMAMASRAMRRILVDYALRRKAQKRGGGLQRVQWNEARFLPDEALEAFLDLNDALRRLEACGPRYGQAVELYYFGGLTLQEAGEVLGISPQTVMRDLRFAEAWLAREWVKPGNA